MVNCHTPARKHTRAHTHTHLACLLAISRPEQRVGLLHALLHQLQQRRLRDIRRLLHMRHAATHMLGKPGFGLCLCWGGGVPAAHAGDGLGDER